jgi:hypothetical protein
MKKGFYIFLFTVLGLLLSQLLHSLIEIGALSLILNNYDKYSQSPLWQNWSEIHDVFSLTMTIVGVTVGFLSGRYFWQKVYE